MALNLRRTKIDFLPDGSAGGLVVRKVLSLNLNFSFLNQILLLLNQVANQLSSQAWVKPIPDPILPEKFLGYSRGSNLGLLGWQSDVLATIPERRSYNNDDIVIVVVSSDHISYMGQWCIQFNSFVILSSFPHYNLDIRNHQSAYLVFSYKTYAWFL